MASGIRVSGTQARIYAPTESYASWRIAYIERATGKRKTTSGGSTREGAEEKARALSGEFVPGYKHGDSPPTVQEAADLWLAAHQSNWSSRTFDAYYYFAKKLTDLYGDRPITQVFPQDIAKLDLSRQNRGQQEKARTLVRGLFGHSSRYIDANRAEQLAQGVKLSGSSGGKRNPRVERGDIPSSLFVASAIITAYHTLQIGPLNDPAWTDIDETTGQKRHRSGGMRVHPGIGLVPATADSFVRGLPLEITDRHRRGIPNHYSDPAGRRRAETLELASRHRQIGLATALGAGGGLRIGELLALRVRHFLKPEDIALMASLDWRLGALNVDGSRNYSGALDVSEQASQASRGKIWVSGTKGSNKSRTVHLPAFLPNWTGFGIGTHRPQIAAVVPRLANPGVSLWDATEAEARQLWREGFTPLGFLLWQRLRELWADPTVRGLALGPRVKEFRELLLFPTRNRARPGRDGEPSVLTDPGWRKSTRIVEGAGTYQAQGNWAKLTNPLMDYVAEQRDEWPEHRTNSEQRKGWTHHGLRHWAVSSRIQAGIPLPIIAREMGHSDAAFTLERYGHVLDQGVGPVGFEY
ncbi:hypothetical protein C5E12_08285 [Rathayibacter rathayi]|uniref:tyrosine-type recombinase/integrase n=1 Tax=Rathayibacter rathayi TaxID=33887 RepID=UPI000CE82683|nr:tyrosine-type recombinase/integrase [Rathayibacter rathayi]PPI70873.1 hypothetical protein C5E12_08285 [Rathayibacter rathayi]